MNLYADTDLYLFRFIIVQRVTYEDEMVWLLFYVFFFISLKSQSYDKP